MAESAKPNVLILGMDLYSIPCSAPIKLMLGGVNTFSRHLAALLVPEEGDRLVNVRIDRFPLPDPTYLKYLILFSEPADC
jgi:hypothetical protein